MNRYLLLSLAIILSGCHQHTDLNTTHPKYNKFIMLLNGKIKPKFMLMGFNHRAMILATNNSMDFKYTDPANLAQVQSQQNNGAANNKTYGSIWAADVDGVFKELYIGTEFDHLDDLQSAAYDNANGILYLCNKYNNKYSILAYRMIDYRLWPIINIEMPTLEISKHVTCSGLAVTNNSWALIINQTLQSANKEKSPAIYKLSYPYKKLSVYAIYSDIIAGAKPVSLADTDKLTSISYASNNILYLSYKKDNKSNFVGLKLSNRALIETEVENFDSSYDVLYSRGSYLDDSRNNNALTILSKKQYTNDAAPVQLANDLLNNASENTYHYIYSVNAYVRSKYKGSSWELLKRIDSKSEADDAGEPISMINQGRLWYCRIYKDDVNPIQIMSVQL